MPKKEFLQRKPHVLYAVVSSVVTLALKKKYIQFEEGSFFIHVNTLLFSYNKVISVAAVDIKEIPTNNFV